MSRFTKIIVLILVSLPATALAQEPAVYKPLVNILGGETPSFDAYINLLYTTSITLAALLAVVKIIIAGAKYMLSDVISNKGEALGEIKGALLGLLLIVGAYLILNVINPQLLTNDLTGTFNKIPVGTPAKTSSLGTMATPPVLGDKNLLDTLDLDKVPGGTAEKTVAFNTFRVDCKAKGGEVVLVTRTTRDCKNVVTPAVITKSPVPGSPASNNPTAEATAPTILWTKQAQGGGGVAVLRSDCTSGNYNKLEPMNGGYSCISPKSVTDSVSNGKTGIFAGYECPNGGVLQSSTATGEGLERLLSSSKCVIY
jgi:hypothetical protein